MLTKIGTKPAVGTVVIRFGTFEDELTLERRVEVRALDPGTGLPVASLPLREMSDWLVKHGFRHRQGSSGIWDREG